MHADGKHDQFAGRTTNTWRRRGEEPAAQPAHKQRCSNSAARNALLNLLIASIAAQTDRRRTRYEKRAPRAALRKQTCSNRSRQTSRLKPRRQSAARAPSDPSSPPYNSRSSQIRKEKEESKRLAEEKVKEEEDAKLTEAAMLGNPLLQSGGSGGKQMKRKWNDDVVFRNQAKKEPDQNTKRFINDTVRNDFHKRFMDKFMK